MTRVALRAAPAPVSVTSPFSARPVASVTETVALPALPYAAAALVTSLVVDAFLVTVSVWVVLREVATSSLPT